MVISTSCSRASRSSRSTSSGLAKRASATVVDSPSAASSSAAFRHSPSRVPKDKQRHLVALAHDAALADLERLAFRRHRHAEAFAARIAQRRRPVVDRDRGRHHVHQLGLVGRRHQHEAGQAAEIGDVEGAGMGRAVGADQAGAVDGEAHRQALDRDVVHHLVVGALQEGRIDRGERLEAFGRQAGREGHRVLLGDADVEAAVGEFLGEQVEPGAGRHRRGDGDDLVVLARLLDQALGEDLGVVRRAALGLGLRAGGDVELDHAVIFVGGGFRRRVALALLRDDVDQDRPDLGVAHVAQHRQQVVEIVAVDRADIVEAEFLEQRAAGDEVRACSTARVMARSQLFGRCLVSCLPTSRSLR